MTTETQLPGVERYAGPSSRMQMADAVTKDEDEISLIDLLIVLGEQKKKIAYVTATFAIVAFIVSLILPQSYTATVTVLPPQQNSSMGSLLASQLGSLGGMAALAGGSLGIKNPNDMYVAMLKSRTVEDAMVQHYGLMQEYHSKLASDARKSFESYATVDAAGKDNLIHISLEDRDPNRAAELANGYVEQFRALSQHLAISEASQRRLFFEQELQQAKNNLANAEEALKQTEQTTGLIELSSQAKALIESAAGLRAQITAREVEIQGMQTYATGENSQLIQAQKELDGLRAQLARLGGSEDNASGGFIVSKGRVPEVGLEYERKLRDVKYNETIFEILARQFEVAKLDEAKEGALIQVVDPAVAPDKHSFPKRGLIVIGATVIGLFMGILFALLQAGFEHLKDDPETSGKLSLLKRTLSLRKQRTA